jgi:hypothetical protein
MEINHKNKLNEGDDGGVAGGGAARQRRWRGAAALVKAERERDEGD